MSNYGRPGPPGPVSKCQKVRLTFDTLTQCQSVKVSDTAGPLCVKFSKKRSSSLVSMFIDRRCVSKSRPAVGPLCVKLCKKRSSSVSNLGAPRGPCQNVSKFRPHRVSKCQFRPAPRPAPLLTRPNSRRSRYKFRILKYYNATNCVVRGAMRGVPHNLSARATGRFTRVSHVAA